MVNLKQLSHLLPVIKNNWQDMNWWKDVITKSYYKKIIGNNGVCIMEEDWDNLLILDACRYDIFEEFNIIPGRLEYRVSRGSCTNEFLIENFKDKKFNDTVYVTANPLVNYHVGGSFYRVVPVWKYGWANKYETVLPKTMVEYSMNAEKEYPNKRLIVHFVQPHYPFIGETGRNKIGAHVGIAGGENAAIGKKWLTDPKPHIWRLARDGKVNIKTVWEAYTENLQLTLPYVKELVGKLSGKTIISADHANLFGERIPPLFSREYGHPGGIYVKNLVKVPWLVIESKNRKEIIEEKKSDRTLLERKKINVLKKIGKI